MAEPDPLSLIPGPATPNPYEHRQGTTFSETGAVFQQRCFRFDSRHLRIDNNTKFNTGIFRGGQLLTSGK